MSNGPAGIEPPVPPLPPTLYLALCPKQSETKQRDNPCRPKAESPYLKILEPGVQPKAPLAELPN